RNAAEDARPKLRIRVQNVAASGASRAQTASRLAIVERGLDDGSGAQLGLLADWTISRLQAGAIQCGHVKTAVAGSFGNRLPSGHAFVTLPEQHDGQACQVIRRPRAEFAAGLRPGWSGGPRTPCVLTSMAPFSSPPRPLDAAAPPLTSPPMSRRTKRHPRAPRA